MKEQINTYLIDIKQKVDAEIDKHLQNDNPLIEALYKSAAYSAAGGKRLRAVFTSLIARLFGASPQKLISGACAVELVHAASLIMDDLPYMDDSQLRRGKPANHVVFGQDVALLASIGLISEAAQLLLDDDQLDTNEKNEAALILTSSFGFNGLAAGQFVDLKLQDRVTDFEIFRFINRHKTASLFIAAGKIAALIGKADDKQKNAVLKFSENIGLAFQIVDDIIDSADASDFIGSGQTKDKTNFVNLAGMDKAREYVKEYHQKAEAELNIFGSKADDLKDFSNYLIKRVD